MYLEKAAIQPLPNQPGPIILHCFNSGNLGDHHPSNETAEKMKMRSLQVLEQNAQHISFQLMLTILKNRSKQSQPFVQASVHRTGPIPLGCVRQSELCTDSWLPRGDHKMLLAIC